MVKGNIGKKIADVPVRINYRIIELFSAGLYSSPNKAFEELICNSYDAHADKVSVVISTNNENSSDDHIWVCDNGDSMDIEGLIQLWKIGSSNKRENENTESGRLQIGKFGIGKLATYILTKKLTYICKKNRSYKLVSMDYSIIDDESDKEEEITLDLLELTASETKAYLSKYLNLDEYTNLDFTLFGRDSEKTWTFVLMHDLKDKAYEISLGRLNWILRTALPLNPGFNLMLDGKVIESSKIELEPIKTWIIGEEDNIIEDNDDYECSTYNNQYSLVLPNLNNVTGYCELYRDSLLRGKSLDLGRSHGIFVLVRGRLVNLDDPLLGLPVMYHGVFNRLRIVINADELDQFLTSTRESFKDSKALMDLQEYIKKKFNEIRSYYENLLDEESREARASSKISRTSTYLSRKPFLSAVKKFFNEEIDNLWMTNIPENLIEDEKLQFIDQLEEDLTSEIGIIKETKWEPLNPEDPLAIFDILPGIARINILHPFFSNFMSEVKSPLIFHLIATAEILTECLLLEKGIEQEKVLKIMKQRDKLLRELTYNENPNSPLVAQMINESLSNPNGLENALFHAFRRLGFETQKIGGSGEPDGKAEAILGVRKSGGENLDYSIVYDAKSTSNDRIQAQTAHISGIVRHRDDIYEANYAVVVAINFAGADDPNSAVNLEAKRHKVTLIKAKDLLTLVLYSIPKQISLIDLKDLFDNCHTVIETNKWIEEIKNREIEKTPIKEFLETTYSMMSDIEPPHLHTIRYQNEKLKQYGDLEKLRVFVRSLESLLPRYISIDDSDIVNINAKPDIIMESINRVIEIDIPNALIEIYLSVFDQL